MLFIPYFIKNLKVTISLVIIIICTVLNSCQRTVTFSSDSVPYIPKQANFHRKNLVLVLGGGGAKGFAHVGVIEELEKAGIIPDAIIGCSAGSIIGALYAANPSYSQLKAAVLEGKRSDVISLGLTDWPYSVYSIHGFKKYLKKNLKVHTFEQLKIPFIATATNLQYGNLTAFSRGELIDPVAASAAYPGAFFPVKIKGQYFVDGGVADPVPVHIAKELGFKTIIAVNIASQLTKSNPRHLFGIVKRSLEIAYINQTKYAVEGADVVIDFNFRDIDVFTDQYNYYLYEEGRKSAKKAIPKILQLLNLKQK